MEIIGLVENLKDLQLKHNKQNIQATISFTVRADTETKSRFVRVSPYHAEVDIITRDEQELSYALVKNTRRALEVDEMVYDLTINEYIDEVEYSDSYEEDNYYEYEDDIYYGEDYYCIDYLSNRYFEDIEEGGTCFEVLPEEANIYNKIIYNNLEIVINLDADGGVKVKNSECPILFEKIKSFNVFAKQLGVDLEYTVLKPEVSLEDINRELIGIQNIQNNIISSNKLNDKPYTIDTWLRFDSSLAKDTSGIYIVLESYNSHPHYQHDREQIKNYPVTIKFMSRTYWIDGVSPIVGGTGIKDRSYYCTTSIVDNLETRTNLTRYFRDNISKYIVEGTKKENISGNVVLEINLTKIKEMNLSEIENSITKITNNVWGVPYKGTYAAFLSLSYEDIKEEDVLRDRFMGAISQIYENIN